LLIVVCPFVLFLLAIVLSVLLRYTDSDYPFGIFKPFLTSFMDTHSLCDQNAIMHVSNTPTPNPNCKLYKIYLIIVTHKLPYA